MWQTQGLQACNKPPAPPSQLLLVLTTFTDVHKLTVGQDTHCAHAQPKTAITGSDKAEHIVTHLALCDLLPQSSLCVPAGISVSNKLIQQARLLQGSCITQATGQGIHAQHVAIHNIFNAHTLTPVGGGDRTQASRGEESNECMGQPALRSPLARAFIPDI